MNPRFSVVIPLWNKGPYIFQALESVLNQTEQDFELLVIYEDSEDNSLEVVRAFTDSRIRVIERGCPGTGGDEARNRGIVEAVGDWVCFLDADDAWYPEQLAHFSELAKAFPDARFLTTARRFDRGGLQWLDTFSQSRPPVPTQFSFREFTLAFARGTNPVNCNSVAVERDAACRFLKFPGNRTGRSGDTYAWQRLAASVGGFAWCPYVGSITFRDRSRAYRAGLSSIPLSLDMVDELRSQLEPRDLRALKRYANTRIVSAWHEHVSHGQAVPPLAKLLFWEAEPLRCMHRCVRSVRVEIRRRFPGVRAIR